MVRSWYDSLTDQYVHILRIDRVRGDAVLNIQNSQWTMFLKWRRVITQLVQENTQRPYIAFFVDWSLRVYINHLRSSILQCCVPVQVGFKSTNFLHVCW